jgi:diaminohydroxyphosphoribosylaminopyrimidine deaminase/5-amino-6-(5-phosphoribosylamino)uracil reductase
LERRRGHAVDRTDATYLARAAELAARAIADAAPNPPVGAVIVRDGRTLGEGWHHRKGEAHAEAEALAAARAAGEDPRGATMYVTLEPHDHESTVPPCSRALIAAGIGRVVVGALDPNERTHGRGIARMRDAGITVDVVDDPRSLALIERFRFTIANDRPYLTVKMACSLDGCVAPARATFAVTGDAARRYVHELRADHDAVMVGAGTVRVDDPLLTVRPHHTRRKPYVRVVVCETAPVPASSRVFATPAAPAGAYARTIVLAPAGAAPLFRELTDVAEVLFVGGPDERALDLRAALAALRAHGIASVLCEGGPTLAGRLLAHGLAQRVTWLVAPRFLQGPRAVPVLAGADLASAANGWAFDRVERLGDDVMLSAPLTHV